MTAHTALAACWLAPRRRVPPGLRAPEGASVTRRLNVHRNNIVAGLTEVLTDAYPVLHRLVGDAHFQALAAAFVRAQPPRSPCLHGYGAGLAEWLGGFAPVRRRARLAFLPDLARLEWLRRAALYAEDGTADHPDALHQALAAPQPPADLGDWRACLQPALGVLHAPYAVVSIWAAHQGDDAHLAQTLPGLDWRQPEHALVLRDHDGAVHTLALPAASARWVAGLAAGHTLAEAAQQAGPGLDLAPVLAQLVRHGAVLGWHPPAARPCHTPG